jgi:hypothetical protein
MVDPRLIPEAERRRIVAPRQNESHGNDSLKEEPVLWDDIPLVDTETFEPECKICYEKNIEVACMPCGHCYFCKKCWERYKKDKENKRQQLVCPVCMEPVKELADVTEGDLNNLMKGKQVIICVKNERTTYYKELFLSSQLRDLHLELSDDKHLGLEELLWKLRDMNKITLNPD